MCLIFTVHLHSATRLSCCVHTWRSPSTHGVARFYSLCARIRCRVIRSRFNQNGRTFAIISAHNCAISEIYLSYLLGNLLFKSLPENSTNVLTKFQHSGPGDADWTLSALFASRMNLFDLYFISRPDLSPVSLPGRLACMSPSGEKAGGGGQLQVAVEQEA